MYDTLRELHRKFWKELPVPEVERQYDEAFRELMRRLEKPLELTTESQQHKKERSEEALAVLCATEEGQNEN